MMTENLRIVKRNKHAHKKFEMRVLAELGENISRRSCMICAVIWRLSFDGRGALLMTSLVDGIKRGSRGGRTEKNTS